MKLFLKAARTVTRSYLRFTENSRSEIVRHSLPINVEPTLTIGALKALLKPHRWVPKKNLLLIHSDKSLDDDSVTLGECLVKDKDTLLVCKSGSYSLRVSDIYKYNNYFNIPVSSCLETVRDVMEKIHLVTGYHPDDQILRFGRRRIDDEGARLVNLDIVPNNPQRVYVIPMSTPEMPASTSLPAKFLAHIQDLTCHTRRDMNIFVEKHKIGWCSCMSLGVRLTDTIDTLKTQITLKTYFGDDDDGGGDDDDELMMSEWRYQSLVCGHKLLANGSATLAEYGIKEHDVIQICRNRRFEILVSWASSNYKTFEEPQGLQIEVVCFDTLRDLKENIEKKTGIPVCKQDLSLYGISLNNDEWCLLDYGILPCSNRNGMHPNGISYGGDIVMLDIKENHSR